MTSDDQIARGVVGDGEARVVAVVATELVQEAVRRHAAVGDAAVAMGRAATAGLLLATLTKDDERVTLQILGDGPLGTLTVDAAGAGTARVYVSHPQARPLVPRAGPSPAGETRPSLGAAVGRRGLVSVVRDVGLGQNFSGQTSIVDGEIDTDVEHYLSNSEQIDSALGCDTRLRADGSVQLAVGILVQALPGGTGAALVAEVRRRLRADVLGAGQRSSGATPPTPTPISVMQAALGDDAARLKVLDERPVRFHCSCTPARAAATLGLLGDADLVALIRDEGRADVTCEFCRARYDFSDADLEAIRRGIRGPTAPPS